MYYPRTLEAYITQASRQFSVLLLIGARQVGKTTLLQHSRGAERAYVTLDDPLLLDLAKSDPALFLQQFPAPLLIDEIQYAPELLPYIKMAVDRHRRAGLFWLTGSQQFHLMQGLTESLAGRVAVVSLLGMARREVLGQADQAGPFLPQPDLIAGRVRTGKSLSLPNLYEGIWKGALPAAVLNPDLDHDLFYSSYVQTYLQRDVRSLARVGDELAFLRFIRAAAARTGQLLNLSELARDTDIAVNTAKQWLSILQVSGIVYLLEPWYTSVTKRLVKTPKLYFLDTGLCAYLTGWSSPATLAAGAMAGAILETWILAELLKSYWHNGRQPRFYYYRDKDRKEIDVLILQDGTLYPLECKKTASPRRDHVRHFTVLDRLNMPIGPGGLICLVEQCLPLTTTVQAIPVSAL